MKYLRTGGGLGDAIWLRAIAIHLLKRGEQVVVFNKWSDVFKGLPLKARSLSELTPELPILNASFPAVLPFPKGLRCFEVACRAAGITDQVDLRMDWQPWNAALLEKIKAEAAGRKILVYQPMKIMTRRPEALLIRPRRAAFIKFLDDHRDHYRIKLGHPPTVERGEDLPCELDLYGKAFILDTFDVGTVADLLFCQASFVNVMAEAMDKRYVCMIARAGLESQSLRAKYVTPERIVNKPELATVIYDD